MKKKVVSIVLCLAVLATLTVSLCSCSGSDNKAVTINVYNWGEYIDQDVLQMFTDKTGIKVNYTTYASNEEMYSKVVSGAASYDVIIPSEYMISKMISEDLLAKLNFDNITNYSLIGDDYKGLAYDPDEAYSVPYTWGTVVVIYNTKYVDEADVADKSINLLWNEKYKDHILMFDNPRDAFALALTKLGYSMNSENADEWNQASAELIKQKPLVQAYVMDQIFDKMISEEAYIAPYYAGDAITIMEANENIAAYVPTEGANKFFDAMCVLKSSQHQAEAEAFINFMCDTDIAVMNANEVCYAIPQTAAFEKLDEETKNDELIYPPKATLDRCEVFTSLSAETMLLQSDLWAKLKTENN